MKKKQKYTKAWRAATRAAMALSALGAAHVAAAAEAETDVMGKGNTQLEFRLATQHDSGAYLREYSTPLFARVGLTDSLELRLGTKGRIASTSANVTTRGWTDASVGLRLQTQELDGKTGVAGRAWQLELGLPTGTNAFHAPSVSTALKFTAEWALPEDFSLGVMPGLIYQRNGANEWFTAPSFAVTLGKNWTPAFRTVVELAAPQITSNSNGGKVASVNLGATYRLTDTFELEAVYARGVTQNTPAHGFAAGVNFKF